MTAHAEIAVVLASWTRLICRGLISTKKQPLDRSSAHVLAKPCGDERGEERRHQNMIQSPPPDWARDISRQLRTLVDAGATDTQLDRFILARNSDDHTLAASVSNEVQASQSSGRLHRRNTPASDLEVLRSQTLSLVVNTLCPTKLYAFVCWLWPLSELLHRKYRLESFWSHQQALAVMAKALCDDVLSRIQTNSHEIA
jgi:hypothetical protein